MAVHSFSTKTKKPQDELLVERVKKYCTQRHINFSGIVLEQLKKFEEEVINGKV